MSLFTISVHLWVLVKIIIYISSTTSSPSNNDNREIEREALTLFSEPEEDSKFKAYANMFVVFN